MNRFLRSFFALLILLAGSLALVGGTGYAEPGGFDVPKVNEDFNQFEHTPAPQKQQPIHNTEVQAEEKGFWDKTTEFVKDGWQWFKDKGSDFIDWTKEAAAAFWEAFEKILDLLKTAVIVVVYFVVGVVKAIFDVVLEILGILAAPFLFLIGMLFSPKETWASTVNSIQNLVDAIVNIGDTIKGIWYSIKESFVRDVINGDAQSRAEWFGYAAGQIGLAFVGTKGLGSAAKAGKAGLSGQLGRTLLKKLPEPVQKVFRKDTWKGLANKAWSYLRRKNINWKNAAITGAAGTALTVLGFFGIPKIAPAAMKVYKKLDCLVYEQPADSYVAMMLLPKGKCGVGDSSNSSRTVTKVDQHKQNNNQNKGKEKSQTREEILVIVDNILTPYIKKIKEMDPDAKVGYRGSLATGVKGPHKGNAPFDPNDFDIDAFIVSDKLAAEFPPDDWWRSGTNHKQIAKMQKEIDQKLKSSLKGLRKVDKKGRPDRFTFRIFTHKEFKRKYIKGSKIIEVK